MCISLNNPSDVSAQVPNFIPQSFETKSLYHLLEIEQEIITVSSKRIIKSFQDYKIKMTKKFKDLLA